MTFDNDKGPNPGKNLPILTAKRAGAYLIDILILFGILGPSGYLIQRLLGYRAQTGLALWSTILWNFSLPSWLYFTLSDRSAKGATLGKRLFKLRVTDTNGERLHFGRALGRTAIKLVPWELVHISGFALADLSRSSPSPLQSIGLAAANVLAMVYLAITVATRGRRSAHDFVAGTEIRTV